MRHYKASTFAAIIQRFYCMMYCKILVAVIVKLISMNHSKIVISTCK